MLLSGNTKPVLLVLAIVAIGMGLVLFKKRQQPVAPVTRATPSDAPTRGQTPAGPDIDPRFAEKYPHLKNLFTPEGIARARVTQEQLTKLREETYRQTMAAVGGPEGMRRIMQSLERIGPVRTEADKERVRKQLKELAKMPEIQRAGAVIRDQEAKEKAMTKKAREEFNSKEVIREVRKLSEERDKEKKRNKN